MSASSAAAGGGSAAPNIVKAQQAYATSQKLAKLFEDLTTALIYARPADPAAFIAAEATRMAAEGEAYRAKPQNGVVDTEESAAAYWEDERVRSLLEVRAPWRAHARTQRATLLMFLPLALASLHSSGCSLLTLSLSLLSNLPFLSFTAPLLPLHALPLAGAFCPAPAQQT